MGFQSLYSNTTGTLNVAIGTRALLLNTIGCTNIAVGDRALCSNVSGNKNVAIGQEAMRFNTASNNTAVGYYALRSNTTGIENTAIGTVAMCLNTSGIRNTAVGFEALRDNSEGNQNSAFGNITLRSNTTGVCNTGAGYGALFNNTNGICNTALGRMAQCAITSGVNNTIAIGVLAQTSSTTGHTVWGNSGNNVCNCVYAAWSTVSDSRDKTNIQTLPSKLGLDLITKLRPVAFNWDHRDTYVSECKYEYGQKDGSLASKKEHYGLIAQELKSVLEELDVKFDGLGHDDDKDAYRVTYEELIAPIIKAIQEQQIQIESLKSENNTIKSEIEILKQK
jgi:hypothetical protein